MTKLQAWLASLTEQQLTRFHEQVWLRITDGNGYQPYGEERLNRRPKQRRHF